MERVNAFLVTADRLMALSMDLVTLLHSREGMCKWLGSFEEIEENDYEGSYYKHYFEERVGFHLLTLSVLLGTLDDRNLIDEYVKREDPKQLELGKILVNDEWRVIDNLRTVLNFIIHADEVVIVPSVPENEAHTMAGAIAKNTESSAGTILLEGQLNCEPSAIQLDLRAFCDVVFRVAADLR